VIHHAATRFTAAARVRWERSLPCIGIRRVRQLNLDTHALAFGAQQLVCTAPLVVAVGALFRQRPGHGLGMGIARFFGLDHAAAVAVMHLFGRTSPKISTTALLLSLALAVVFAAGVAGVQQRAFELIWNVPNIRSVRSYLYQLAWVPVLAAFTIGMLFVGRFGTWLDVHVPGFGEWSMGALRAVMVIAFYWWSQRLLLSGRVSWRALLPGSIAVGILTVGTLEVAHIFMSDQVTWQLHAYGLIGVAFVISVWLMALSTFVYVGVLIGALLDERHIQRRVAAAAAAAAESTAAGRTAQLELVEADVVAAAEKVTAAAAG